LVWATTVFSGPTVSKTLINQTLLDRADHDSLVR
jgi:hypothetical protein